MCTLVPSLHVRLYAHKTCSVMVGSFVRSFSDPLRPPARIPDPFFSSLFSSLLNDTFFFKKRLIKIFLILQFLLFEILLFEIYSSNFKNT